MSPPVPLAPYAKKRFEMDLEKSEIVYKSSHVKVACDLPSHGDFVLEALQRAYGIIEAHIIENPFFSSSMQPIAGVEDVNPLLESMLEASGKAGVGPMACVAGAVAEYVGRRLEFEGAKEYIVENGGDIYMNVLENRSILVFAGESRFSEKIGFNVKPGDTPLSVCTSAASVGHSISLGMADAAVAFSRDASLADACATRIANMAGNTGYEEIESFSRRVEGLNGFILLQAGEVFAAGDMPELLVY